MRTPGRSMVLGALLGGSGVLHLVRPRTYEWLVPPELGVPMIGAALRIAKGR